MTSRKRGSPARAISPSTADVTSSWVRMIIGFSDQGSAPLYHTAKSGHTGRPLFPSAVYGEGDVIMWRNAVPTLATKDQVNAREAMEALNAEAGKFNIWLRTQANAPAQRP